MLKFKILLSLLAIALMAACSYSQDWGKVTTGQLTYPALDNLDMREGTVECWVKLGFDPAKGLPAKGYTGFVNLFQLEGELGSLRFIYNAQAGATEAAWFCSIAPKTHFAGMFTTHEPWHENEWHHVALSWKEKEIVIYIDGKKAGGRVQDRTLHQGFGPVVTKQVGFGTDTGTGAMVTIDDLRVSRVARQPEELGIHGQLRPDVFTAILDSFEASFVPDGKITTRPTVMMSGEGGLATAPCQFVEGKFGKALAFYKQ